MRPHAKPHVVWALAGLFLFTVPMWGRTTHVHPPAARPPFHESAARGVRGGRGEKAKARGEKGHIVEASRAKGSQGTKDRRVAAKALPVRTRGRRGRVEHAEARVEVRAVAQRKKGRAAFASEIVRPRRVAGLESGSARVTAEPREDVAGDAKDPVAVVSVIRQDGVHPQLEATEDVAATAQALPLLYDGRGHLNMPAALRGSHDILLHQNLMADADGLVRIQDDDDLIRMRQKRVLVPIPVSEGVRVDERLPVDRRYCRPWVAQFLAVMGRAHYAQFHAPIQVNSAVRTVSFQLQLIRRNGNAAQADGDAASPHLTGQAVDIGKKGLSKAEIAWMRLYLMPLVDRGLIDVEEEFKQACFHISIYRKFSPPAPVQRIATTHRELTPALAETME